MNKKTIQKKIELIRNRIGNESGIRGEIVKVNILLTLKGQEAVNFEVAQLLSEHSTPQELITLIFRAGLKVTTQTMKELAAKQGIKL